MKKTKKQEAAIKELKNYYPALPDNLSVGGSLDLRGTQITALPDGNWLVSKVVGSRDDVTSYCISKNEIHCGCFIGTLAQFEKEVHSVYSRGEKFRVQYDDFIQSIKTLLKPKQHATH